MDTGVKKTSGAMNPSTAKPMFFRKERVLDGFLEGVTLIGVYPRPNGCLYTLLVKENRQEDILFDPSRDGRAQGEAMTVKDEIAQVLQGGGGYSKINSADFLKERRKLLDLFLGFNRYQSNF